MALPYGAPTAGGGGGGVPAGMPAYPGAPTGAPSGPAAARPAPTPQQALYAPAPSVVPPAQAQPVAHTPVYAPAAPGGGAAPMPVVPQTPSQPAVVAQPVSSSAAAGPPSSSAAGRHPSEMSSSSDDVVEYEHAAIKFPLSMSMQQMGETYGIGIRLYFDFIRFLALLNGGLALFALLPTIGAALADQCDLSNGNLFFVSSFGAGARWLWVGSSAISFIVWIMAGPCYGWRLLRFYKQHNLNKDFEDQDRLRMEEDDKIAENRRVTTTTKRIRLTISYLILVLLLGVCAATSFGLAFAKANLTKEGAEGSSLQTILSLAISFILSFLNWLWKKLSDLLSRKVEKHGRWSSYRKHKTIKFVSFKMFNVIFLFVAELLAKGAITSETGDCALYSVAEQLGWLLIIDLTLQNVMEILIPLIKRYTLAEKKGMTSTTSNAAQKPKFDVAEEYLELLYRQFVLYLGIMCVPMLAAVGFVGSVLEFYLDKYRMMRICQRPNEPSHSLKRILVILLTVMALSAMLVPPFGGIWTLSGAFYDNDRCCVLT